MKNELKGIYNHIGPSKYDWKQPIYPDEIEEMIKEFGKWIALWCKEYAKYKIAEPAYAVIAHAQMRQTQRDLVFVLKWLGGDD